MNDTAVAPQQILKSLHSFERVAFGDPGEFLGVDLTVLEESANSGPS